MQYDISGFTLGKEYQNDYKDYGWFILDTTYKFLIAHPLYHQEFVMKKKNLNGGGKTLGLSDSEP